MACEIAAIGEFLQLPGYRSFSAAPFVKPWPKRRAPVNSSPISCNKAYEVLLIAMACSVPVVKGPKPFGSGFCRPAEVQKL